MRAGDRDLVSNGPLFQALAKLKQAADITGQDAFKPLDVYTVPGDKIIAKLTA